MTLPTKARFLMCAPDHFGVAYKINPWMDPHSWVRSDQALAAASRVEWATFHRILLDLGAEISLVPPALGVPDLVFTANAAVVLDGVVLAAPILREPILGGTGQISGNFTLEGANNLAILLRSGALPARLTIIEERTLEPPHANAGAVIRIQELPRVPAIASR